MSHIYGDRHEISIPPEAHVNRSDARVYLIDSSDSKRTVIGKATSDSTMFPNDMFKKLYPEIWKTEYAKFNDPIGFEIKVGMYSLCMGAAERSGLYKALLEAYDGPSPVNAIMDFAMYSILSRRNVAQLYAARMTDEIVFSDAVYDDSWWSDFFKHGLTHERHMGFCRVWLKHCQEKGIRNIWLCIDGSNNDCQLKKSEYAEAGDNKSHTHKTIVGYIWAVNAEDGLPITYHVTPGGVVDAQSIQWLVNFLAGYNFEVSGVILDKGFATLDVLNLLTELKIAYVIMLPKCYGLNKMIDECGDTIFWNPEYLVNGSDVYGISKEERIWKKHPITGIINLYYSSRRGHYRGSDLNEEVSKIKENAEKACAAGIRPSIPQKYHDIFCVEQKEDGSFNLNCNYPRWRRLLQGEGFFSMLSSEEFGAKETYDLYSLRMVSEVQFSTTKSQEGFHVTRVHSDPSMLSKLAIAFITTILRHTIRQACQANDLDTNVIIQRTDRVKLMILDSGKLKMIRDIPGNLNKVYEYFGMNYESFEAIALEVNQRKTNAIHSPVRYFPEIKKPAPKKPGRKPGSKNKKTIEKEKAEAEARARGEKPEKDTAKKPGRRRGTKDSKPRKKRSDAGKARGPYRKRAS